MPIRAHVIINGTIYDLPENAGQQGVESQDLKNLAKQIESTNAGQTNIIDVVLDGAPIRLHLLPGHVETYGIWTTERSQETTFPPTRIR